MGRSKRRTAMVTCMLLGSVWGLNPISEGSYALWPRAVSTSDLHAEEGVIFLSGGNAVEIPVSVAVRAAPLVELGAGLQTYWGGGLDHVPFLPLGMKFQATRATTLNLDFLLATHGGEDGLRLGVLTRLQQTSRLASTFSGQLGYGGAFAGGRGTALEGEWIPALRLFHGVSLQWGWVASSLVPDFNGHFALDTQPGVLVDLGRGSALLTQVTLGLAGPKREDVRAEIALAEGF